MLFWNLGLLRSDPVGFLVALVSLAVAVLVAISVHEASHALAADRQGDPTPRSRGRLTLNPLAHLDPLGTLLLFLAGFGWGKPVPVNPAYFRGRPLAGMARVAFAGPLAGLLTAGIISIPFRLLDILPGDFFLMLVYFNIILSIFNLIPIPPLDGFHVLLGLLPPRTAFNLSRYESYGPPVLILLILLDSFAGTGFLWKALGPAVNFFSRLYLGGTFY
jgi:Zn-dependent protease